MAEFTLFRKDPSYVSLAKGFQDLEKHRISGKTQPEIEEILERIKKSPGLKIQMHTTQVLDLCCMQRNQGTVLHVSRQPVVKGYWADVPILLKNMQPSASAAT